MELGTAWMRRASWGRFRSTLVREEQFQSRRRPGRSPGSRVFAMARERAAGAFPGRRAQWLVPAELPDHSGGTAADSHGLPSCHPNFGYRNACEETG